MTKHHNWISSRRPFHSIFALTIAQSLSFMQSVNAFTFIRSPLFKSSSVNIRSLSVSPIIKGTSAWSSVGSRHSQSLFYSSHYSVKSPSRNTKMVRRFMSSSDETDEQKWQRMYE